MLAPVRLRYWFINCVALIALSLVNPMSVFAANHTAEALIANSKLAMRGDPEESKRDAQAALDLLKRDPNPDLAVLAHMQLCDYYSERDRNAAQQESAVINSLLPTIQRQGLRAGALICSGLIAESDGNFTHALELYIQAATAASIYHDNEMLAESLFQRGYVYGLQGQYANGLADLQQAQSLFEQVHLPQHALTALSSVATLYNRLGDYEQALHIYKSALVVQRKENMLREQLVTTYSIGSALEHLQRWDEARDNFNAALQLGEQLNYARGQAYAIRGLAAVSTASDDPQAALELLDRANKLQPEVPDMRLTAQLQLARGMAYLKLQRVTESIAVLEDAKRIFNQADSVNELSSVYTQLALAYTQAGNWRKAYEVRSEGQQISDSVLRNQLDQRYATLKIEFDTTNKEKENTLLTRENAAKQNALEEASKARQWQTVVIALSAMLLVLLGIMVWHQRRGKQHMRNLAMTDELTGVPNRRSVLRQLEGLLQKIEDQSCAMLIIDIDHFKSINDKYGHPVGDEVLRSMAEGLRATVKAPAFSGRLGGEEFVLVLPGHTLDSALSVAEDLRISIAEHDFSRWLGERRVTISVGVTMTVTEDTPSTMLRRADAALYAAKHAGRNCVRCEPPLTSLDEILQLQAVVIESVA